MSTTVELDKQFTTEVTDSHGTISIRVVVLKPKSKDHKDEDDEATPPLPDLDDDEVDVSVPKSKSKSPLSSYLEKQAHGKMCVVFLVNGQRHHWLDKAFIAKDLGFKQLYDRMMIVVDLDGLDTHALAEIIQGSRQGLFEGKVYFAIRDKIVRTLKSDPALKKLQLDAEQKILEMAGGDDAVKNKLDQLIEGHHSLAQADGPGNGDAGPHAADAPHFSAGANAQDVVVLGHPSVGEEAKLPVLVTDPHIAAIRLHPGETRAVIVRSHPHEEWATLLDFRAQFVTVVDGLHLDDGCVDGGSRLTITFTDPDDDDEEYPQGEIQAFARFKDHPETRMLKIPVVGIRKRQKEAPAPIELLNEPTTLKVKSRQPVKLIPGGPAVHVKLEWNGKESLIRGTTPRWKFRARCVTLGTFPSIGFASMADGRLELILYPPHGLMTNTELDFEAVATGPDDNRLSATFRAVVVPTRNPVPPATGPRKITANAPQTAGQRRPPYRPVLIYEKDWGSSDCCKWDGGDWTGDDVGRFIGPTDTQPLLLVINMDMTLLKNYREGMVRGKSPLEARTVNERMNHYIAHVAFHLYQMYWENKQKADNPAPGEDARVATDTDLQEEVNRVGKTLLRLMEVTAR
jgi:hypothetical protein